MISLLWRMVHAQLIWDSFVWPTILCWNWISRKCVRWFYFRCPSITFELFTNCSNAQMRFACQNPRFKNKNNMNSLPLLFGISLNGKAKAAEHAQLKIENRKILFISNYSWSDGYCWAVNRHVHTNSVCDPRTSIFFIIWYALEYAIKQYNNFKILPYDSILFKLRQ